MTLQQPIDLATLPLPAGQVVRDQAALVVFEVDAGMDRGQPDGVVFPRNAEEVAALVRWAKAQGVPLVARGAGTGLSGGAVAEHGGVVVQCSHMRTIRWLRPEARAALAEPGVVNLALDGAARAAGMYYPPDPSSGRSATIGGNIAENSGGPHCFKYGVTTNYISGVHVVLADGNEVRLGGPALDYPEYDLAGLVVGSEGTLGLVTGAYLRMIRNPPALQTLMAAFESVEAAGAAVSEVIARGFIPATLEMMDQKMMRIIEDFTHAGLPIHAGAALIVEADGYAASVGPQIDGIGAILRECGATDLRIAQSAADREAIWYGRKSAVGAMSRLAPAYYLVDITVPRSKLAATLAGVNSICESHNLRVGYVFHAGDGNLHPLILIDDPRDHELLERVHAAGKAIVQLAIGFDGSITGEHGVGIEKRAYMPLMYLPDELDVMCRVRDIFDPYSIFNPGKIFPPRNSWPAQTTVPAPTLIAPGSYAPADALEAARLLHGASEAGLNVAICGSGTPQADADVVLRTGALRGIRTLAHDDLYVTVGAGTPLHELQAELARSNTWVPLHAVHEDATVGGVVSANANAPLRMRYGGVRDLVLSATVALADGRVVRMGRPVVKNVAGYDMPKLFVGAHGTLGLLTDITLKLLPLPQARRSLVVPLPDLAQGVALGAQVLSLCLVASALLLCDGGAAGVDAPYALVYTAEGVAADVDAECAEVRVVLESAGLLIQEHTAGGSEVWADWLRNAGEQKHVARLGAGSDAIGVMALAAASVAPHLLADLANGLLYITGADAIQQATPLAQQYDGYGELLVGQISGYVGHAPESAALQHQIRALFDPRGVLGG